MDVPTASVALRVRTRRLAVGGRGRLGRLRIAVWAPPLALVVGLLIVAGVAASFGVRIGGLILDETLLKQSAVHYTHGLPHNLFHDLTARATSRLYSLVIAPLFAIAHGDVAVRAARGLNGLMFATAAVPAYLLARQVLTSRWLAVAAALLCVAFPWLTLTTAMFSENLAYPLFMWSVVAMAWVFERPTAWRDLLVVALVGAAACTRTQLVSLFGAYAVVITWRLWLDRPSLGAGAAGPWARRVARQFPLTLALTGLGVAGVVWELHSGALQSHLRGLLGGYAVTTSDRGTLPSDLGISMLVEVLALAIGTGVVPALLAAGWYPRALLRAPTPRAHAFAVSSAAAVVVLYAGTLYSQGVYLATATEERYYFYAAPFLWLAALAALESRSVRTRSLLEAGGVLAVVAALVPLPRTLDVESSYFAPAIVSTRYLLDRAVTALSDVLGQSGISERDVLAAVILGVAMATAAAWRGAPRRGPGAALACAVIAQLGLTAVAFAAIDGRIAGVPGRTGGAFADLGFIDRAARDVPVLWIDNQPRSDEGQATAVQRTALLYNDTIERRMIFAPLRITDDNFPLNALPPEFVQVAPATGRMLPTAPAPEARYAVETTDSPFLQLDGRRVAASAGYRLALTRLALPLSARWLAVGLGPDGSLAPGKVASLRAWGRRRLTLWLSSPAAVRASVFLGGTRRTVRLVPGVDRAVTLTSCGTSRGRLAAPGPVLVRAVEVQPGNCP
ncbi:MAG: hypothetical protein M3P44_08105 [Actinomycetota bacterium]|nr:hypothetical protein [Actinomycetota bacterium]